MIQGGLFTRDFLMEGVTEEDAWRSLSAERVATARDEILGCLSRLTAHQNPNEAETEKELIFPVLKAIGWDHVLPQQNQSALGRQDVPDGLMFADAEAMARAAAEKPWQRFQHGLCVLESKRWSRPLDREDRKAGQDGVPSTQMLHYLRRADDLTHGRLRWGILTNGRHWRLYWQGAISVSEDYLEIDLGKVFSLPGCDPDLLDARDVSADHVFKLFCFLFGSVAFVPNEQGRTIHQRALDQGRFWEERVARSLAGLVFEKVFPVLAEGLARHDRARPETLEPAYLDQVRQGALVLLYRLLFVLYAEDRNLLPDETGPYSEYALTRARLDIAKGFQEGRNFSPRAAVYWARLRAIFEAIAHGDDGLGIPPYNGGLFDPDAAPILERIELPDEILAEVIFRISHEPGERGPKYINYRDLSVQQLGSIYERILEFGLVVDADGRVSVDADATERHDTGSFYTPEALVALVIDKAVGPIVRSRREAFLDAAKALAGDRRPMAAKLTELTAHDPAAALLELRVCDPAMGSGHFLVSLVDWLADRVLAAMAEAQVAVTWGEYTSPLAERIAAIRERILEQARAHSWPIVEDQLDDRHVVRRMILKRVVHGVDKNPMAVELAKVSLWLHTFTVGAPLSFLDHHLRCGDSLLGAWVRPTLDAVAEAGGLLSAGQIVRVEAIAATMTEIEETTDNDVAEVAASKEAFSAVEEATRELDAFLTLMTAKSLLGVDFEAKRPRETPDDLRRRGQPADKVARAEAQQEAFDRAAGLRAALGGDFGDPVKLAAGESNIDAPRETDVQAELSGGVGDGLRQRRLAAALVDQARDLGAREHFFHWQTAFSNLWQNLASAAPQGGFDAVIGNPPWVRQEKISAIKPALKDAYEAFDGAADLYVYFVEQGLRLLRPGGRVVMVLNNKWLKAGYAEELRAMLTDGDRAEVEWVVDFGHAKAFFPDADVFPNVIAVRRPEGGSRAEELQVAVVPRDAKPDETLAGTVSTSAFPMPRTAFSKDGWTLEPKPVMDLLSAIQRIGTPLVEYAGTGPLYGIKTGFNQAFLIDSPTRSELIRADPACAAIIRPYLRGQDIERWSAPESGLYMILLKSSAEHPWPWANEATAEEAESIFAKSYPSLYKRMLPLASFPDPKTGKLTGLKHRQDHGRFWWELRPCAYYDAFEKPKIFYQEIQFYPSYALDRGGRFGNNKTFFIPAEDPFLVAVLNSPLMWWHNWRNLPHMKDDALWPTGVKMDQLPIAPPDAASAEAAAVAVSRLAELTAKERAGATAIGDWLRIEFGIEKPGRILGRSERLDADSFAAAVRGALPKRRNLSAAEVARLKAEHAETVEPTRLAIAEVVRLERQLSNLVNEAYGLTPDDVRLMWETAPPRMPLADTNGPG